MKKKSIIIVKGDKKSKNIHKRGRIEKKKC